MGYSLSIPLTYQSCDCFYCKSKYCLSIFFNKLSKLLYSFSNLSLTSISVSKFASLNLFLSIVISLPSATFFLKTSSLISRMVASLDFSSNGAEMQKNPISIISILNFQLSKSTFTESKIISYQCQNTISILLSELFNQNQKNNLLQQKHRMQPESQEQVDLRNPMNRAEKEKQFIKVGQIKQVFTQASQLYQAACEYSLTIRMVKKDHPKLKDLQIIDITLNGRSSEDQIYTNHLFYRNNIRRGNTVLYNKKTKECFWGRKGLMKFFDISQTSLKCIESEDTTNLNDKRHVAHSVIFSEIENVLSCNDEISQEGKAGVQIYRLNKANGENCQISYFQALDEWIIASKNVCIMVRGKQDLKLYPEERYGFSKLMAEAWFNIIQRKDKPQIEKLKKGLINHTIVGEYCGNPDFQHLVKYQNITIYFYAMINNQSGQNCLPPKVSFSFFQANQIPIVKNHQKSLVGRYTSYVQLGKKLLQIYSQVASSSIFEDQQGSVLYFVIDQSKQFCEYISDRYLQKSVPIPEKWQSQPILPRVSSLGKLKTLQYRILRKLRQKLKYFTRLKKANEQNKEKKEDQFKKFQEKYGSYQKQVKHLVKTQKMNKPIQYFFCVGLIAFEFVFRNRKSPKALELFMQHFIDFLSVVFWAIQNKKQLTPNMMNDWQLIQQLRKVQWDNYGIGIVQDYNALLQKIVPKYAQIKKNAKQTQQIKSDPQDQKDDQ